jgi:uncharacterized membrane protein
LTLYRLESEDQKEARRAAAREVIGAVPPATTSQILVTNELFSGPLPSPDILRRYDQVVTGGATRIFDMAEREQAHRMDMDRQNAAAANRGQLFGFIVAVLGIGGGIVLVGIGKPVSGMSVFALCLASLLGAFIWDRKVAKKVPQVPK